MSQFNFQFFGGINLVIEEPERKLDDNGHFQVDEDTISLVNSAINLEQIFRPLVIQIESRQQQVQQQAFDQITSLWVPISSIGIPALAGLVGAWIQAKYGRKVKFKRGDFEVEASNVDEIERLLAIKDLLDLLEQEAVSKNYSETKLIHKSESREEEMRRIKVELIKAIDSYKSTTNFILNCISNGDSIEEIREIIKILKI